MSLKYAQPSDDSLIELAVALDLLTEATMAVLEVFRHVPLTVLNLNRLATEVAASANGIRREIDEAMVAFRLLIDHRPLATSFPDGTLPPAVLSPRQVAFLSGLASKSPR